MLLTVQQAVQQGQQTGGLSGFLKGWGSLIVATVALVQPWVIGLLKRWLRRGTIDIHETLNIEVGYSILGPTIGLRGTLVAVHRDQFVREIEARVVKTKDGSTHRFNWLFFRAEKINAATGSEETVAELAAGFMLLMPQPHRYSILFRDSLTRDEFQPQLDNAATAWFFHAADPSKGGYTTFSLSPAWNQARAFFERKMYWEKTTYHLEMVVKTARPNRMFKKSWGFVLSEDDMERLSGNPAAILQANCGQTPTYYFVNPAYQELGTEGPRL